MDITDARKELLLKMYDQMFNDINRHITVIWQSVGVLVGAFAILSFTEKQIISLDVAATLILIIGGWLLGHCFDAAYWYNRNLVIIANIEREFLFAEDLKKIHYYFGKHRDDNKMIKHLRIQFALGIGIMSFILLVHFFQQVLPGLNGPWSSFDPQKTLPYIGTMIITILLFRFKKSRDKRYRKFKENSPGIDVQADGVDYSIGHGN
jgi:hypothetical protein